MGIATQRLAVQSVIKAAHAITTTYAPPPAQVQVPELKSQLPWFEQYACSLLGQCHMYTHNCTQTHRTSTTTQQMCKHVKNDRREPTARAHTHGLIRYKNYHTARIGLPPPAFANIVACVRDGWCCDHASGASGDDGHVPLSGVGVARRRREGDLVPSAQERQRDSQ